LFELCSWKSVIKRPNNQSLFWGNLVRLPASRWHLWFYDLKNL